MALSLFPRFGSFFDDFDAFGMSVGPAVHVRESQDGIVLELEVPRYRAEELSVEVKGRNLVIQGKRNMTAEHEQSQFLVGDAPMSSFRRVVYIPETFTVEKETHELNFGVFSIRIPRAPTPPPPPPPQPLPIGGAAAAPAQAPGAIVPFTDKHGLQVTATSTPAEYNAVATMRWPPKVKVDDSNDKITYTASMPPSVGRDHIDLSLDGQNLHFTVHHQRNVVKKDAKGNVVYNQDQSVQYSTNLQVPQDTTAADISTTYEQGQLVITVTKHANPAQQVPVK